MGEDCLDTLSEIDMIIFSVIDQATMENMVDFAGMRDEVIDNVGDLLYEMCSELGIEEVKRVVKNELKVTYE